VVAKDYAYSVRIGNDDPLLVWSDWAVQGVYLDMLMGVERQFSNAYYIARHYH